MRYFWATWVELATAPTAYVDKTVQQKYGKHNCIRFFFVGAFIPPKFECCEKCLKIICLILVNIKIMYEHFRYEIKKHEKQTKSRMMFLKTGQSKPFKHP